MYIYTIDSLCIEGSTKLILSGIEGGVALSQVWVTDVPESIGPVAKLMKFRFGGVLRICSSVP